MWSCFLQKPLANHFWSLPRQMVAKRSLCGLSFYFPCLWVCKGPSDVNLTIRQRAQGFIWMPCACFGGRAHSSTGRVHRSTTGMTECNQGCNDDFLAHKSSSEHFCLDTETQTHHPSVPIISWQKACVCVCVIKAFGCVCVLSFVQTNTQMYVCLIHWFRGLLLAFLFSVPSLCRDCR